MQYRLGLQVLGELNFCNREPLDDQAVIRVLLHQAAQVAGSTLISVHVHRFQPYGLSGVAILAESHLAIHTWPELAYAAIDAFTCGDHVDPHRAVDLLARSLGSRCTSTMTIERGMQPAMAALE